MSWWFARVATRVLAMSPSVVLSPRDIISSRPPGSHDRSFWTWQGTVGSAGRWPCHLPLRTVFREENRCDSASGIVRIFVRNAGLTLRAHHSRRHLPTGIGSSGSSVFSWVHPPSWMYCYFQFEGDNRGGSECTSGEPGRYPCQTVHRASCFLRSHSTRRLPNAQQGWDPRPPHHPLRLRGPKSASWLTNNLGSRRHIGHSTSSLSTWSRLHNETGQRLEEARSLCRANSSAVRPICQASAAYDDMDASQLFDLYDSTLRSTLEEFVPIHTIKSQFQPSTPWFDDDSRTIKRQVRMLERRYRRSGDPEDRLSWIEAARNKHRTFREKENMFWEIAVASNSGNPGKFWRTVTSLLGVPSHSSTVQPAFSAEDFLGFMGRKVETVRADTTVRHRRFSVPWSVVSVRLSWAPRRIFRRIIQSSPAKSCELDPAPTFFVKDFLDCLLPFITRMCNVSLEESLPSSITKEGYDHSTNQEAWVG